jgi:DNA-binding response OmpR family regulator
MNTTPGDIQPNQILAGKKVFIVEDDLFLGRILARKIGSDNVHVSSFENGELAVDALKNEVPDLLLLDLLLPQMNGFEVLKFVRGNEQTKNLKVIVISNTDQAADRQHVKDLGAEFVTKAIVTPDTILKYAAEMIKDGKIVHEEI